MRALGSTLFALAASAVALTSSAARADTMDPVLNRFVLVDANNPDCRTSGPGGGAYYNPTSGYRRCTPDNVPWANLVAQFGAALAPSAMHPARTTGYGGFELALEGDFTVIDRDQDYWKRGTQGPQDPTQKTFSTLGDPDAVLQVYMLRIAKGLPFGFELVGNVGYVARTSIVVGGADVRWSLFEGFRTGIPAIFPELTVGGSVRTITGAEQMQLTVVGADGTLSKPFGIGGSVVFTPYIGYQYLRIFGDSGLIDLTPNTDALAYCNFQGPNTPASPDPGKVDQNGNPYYDGQPVCGNGTTPANSADFNNNVVFTPVRLNRHRLGGGFNFRFQMVQFGFHFISDVVDVKDANKDQLCTQPDCSGSSEPQWGPIWRDAATRAGNTQVDAFPDVARQWTLSVSLGAVL
ncbi:MAG: hypothetical protein R3B70_25540 [Polyangiaceae bacterium]